MAESRNGEAMDKVPLGQKAPRPRIRKFGARL
jgi:hypothetical protein